MKRVLIGHVPVDSAAVVICDPAYLDQFDPEAKKDGTKELCQLVGAADLNDMHRFEAPELPFSRDAAWVAHCSKNHGAILGKQAGDGEQRYGFAVAVATGLGDGCYPVYAEVVSHPFWGERVVRIVVDCSPEDDSW